MACASLLFYSFVPNGLKGGTTFVAFADVSTDDFYCYFVYSFYPILVLVHLCLETSCSNFSISSITIVFVANMFLQMIWGLFMNHFMILNYVIQIMWHLVQSCFDIIPCGMVICIPCLCNSVSIFLCWGLFPCYRGKMLEGLICIFHLL